MSNVTNNAIVGTLLVVMTSGAACAAQRRPRDLVLTPFSVPMDAGVAARPSVDDALTAAPVLEPTWHATRGRLVDSLARVGSKLGVLALEPNGTVMRMLDATTGVEIWHAQAAPDRPWSEIDVGRKQVILSGTDYDNGWASAFALDNGERAWTTSSPPRRGWEFGDDGLAVHVSEYCSSRLVDPATGRVSGPIPGRLSRARYFPAPQARENGRDPFAERDADTTRQACTSWPRIFGGASRSVVTVFDARSDKPTLVAMDPSAASPSRGGLVLDRWPLSTAKNDDRSAILWTDEGGELLVLEIQFAPLRMTWKRSFPLREACPRPEARVRFVGKTLVAQACETITRLDPGSGTTIWTRDVGDALGAIEGEFSGTEREPYRRRPFADAHRLHTVVWLDPERGTTRARAAMPKEARKLYLAPAGVLFVEARADGFGFVGTDGFVKWHRGPGVEDATPLGPFVVGNCCKRDGVESMAVVDRATGAVVGVLPGAAAVLGFVPDDLAPSGLVVATDHEVLGFSLPARRSMSPRAR